MFKFLSSRKGRLLLGVALPPIMGASFLAVPAAAIGLISDDKNTGFFVFAMYWFAFIIMGFPSLIYSFVMEYLVNRKIKNDILAVSISALLGAMAGSISLLIGPSVGGFIYVLIGVIVGAAVGMLLRKLLKNELDNKRMQPDRSKPASRSSSGR